MQKQYCVHKLKSQEATISSGCLCACAKCMKLKEKLADTNMCSIPTFLRFVILVLPKPGVEKNLGLELCFFDFQWSCKAQTGNPSLICKTEFLTLHNV